MGERGAVTDRASEYELDGMCGTCGAYWQCHHRDPESVAAGYLDVDANPDVSDPYRRPDVQLTKSLQRMASSQVGRISYPGTAFSIGQLAQDAMARPKLVAMPLSRRFDKDPPDGYRDAPMHRTWVAGKWVNDIDNRPDGKTWVWPDGVYGVPQSPQLTSGRSVMAPVTIAFSGVDDLLRAFDKFRAAFLNTAKNLSRSMWSLVVLFRMERGSRPYIDNPHIERFLEELYPAPLISALGARAPPC